MKDRYDGNFHDCFLLFSGSLQFLHGVNRLAKQLTNKYCIQCKVISFETIIVNNKTAENTDGFCC